MSTQNFPSLHCLSINVLYQEALIKELENEKTRYSKRIAREYERATRNGTTPNFRHWYENLLRTEIYLEVARDFIAADFGDVKLCTADDLKVFLKRVVKESVKSSKLSKTPRNDFFEPPTVELDYEQSKRISQEYGSYVTTHSADPIVELWTREDDENNLEKGFLSAPHQIFDYYMLKNAGLYSNAFDNFNPSDPLASDGEAVWSKIRALYQLVINAPRAPIPLLLVRTVRNRKRMPIGWFKTFTNQDMSPGDSIITPTFLSTSLHDVSQTWEMFGAHAPQAQYDAYQITENCCIMQILVSKGVPMLPLGDFKSNEHAYENEVLLPPGIQLVLLDRSGVSETSTEEAIETYSFLARVGRQESVTG